MLKHKCVFSGTAEKLNFAFIYEPCEISLMCVFTKLYFELSLPLFPLSLRNNKKYFDDYLQVRRNYGHEQNATIKNIFKKNRNKTIKTIT